MNKENEHYLGLLVMFMQKKILNKITQQIGLKTGDFQALQIVNAPFLLL